ncbi:hypothetical protein HYV84_04960 [Candidatus Woesearchaeota archaeon]|nr:hypothetical protein [Candidatus Woesearchaeota archaeon]
MLWLGFFILENIKRYLFISTLIFNVLALYFIGLGLSDEKDIAVKGMGE